MVNIIKIIEEKSKVISNESYDPDVCINGNRIIEDEYSDEDMPEMTNQKFTSRATSVNGKSGKLPAIAKLVDRFMSAGDVVLDYGGGDKDVYVDYLAEKDIECHVYDPYNRSDSYNRDTIAAIKKNGGADIITCSNVLNVIAEPESRNVVIKNIYRFLKTGHNAYFTVYEGSSAHAGVGRQTGKDQYQTNMKTSDYVSEIAAVFGENNVVQKGKLIIATK